MIGPFNVRSELRRRRGWQVVSMCTRGSVYEVEVDKLIGTMMRLDIPHVVFQAESRGNWLENTAMTNEAIMLALDQYRGRNIVWVDADARFLRFPTLFNGYLHDIGLYMPKVADEGSGHIEFTTGTMFFRNSCAVRRFWRDYVQFRRSLETEVPCQHILGPMLLKSGLRVDLHFPQAYCYIADPVPVHGPLPKKEIVIWHKQCKRRYIHGGFRAKI